MRIAELILGLLALVAISIKFLLWPGGSFLTMIVFYSLAFFYLVFSFLIFNGIRLHRLFKDSNYKEITAKTSILSVLLGISFSVLIFGAMFKLLLWNGANQLLSNGLISSAILAGVVVKFYLKDRTEFYRKIFRRIAIIGGLGLILLLTPTTTLVDIFYRKHPEYAEAFKAVLANPDDLRLRKELQIKEDQMIEREIKEFQHE